jgi:pimeloyl-ACP methyl ester carboxylesterase
VPGERRDQQLVRTDDGRELCFAEWGDPAGFPVFLLHGTPGARYNRPPDESLLHDLGARVVTYDRPGYGRSSRHRGRSVVDCVADVLTIAGRLGVDGFSVTGSSGGGPHVLAVAARLPELVARARCNVGLAPYDAPGVDFFARMDPVNAAEFALAVEGEARLEPHLRDQLADMRRRMADDPTTFLGEEWQLADRDRALLADPELVAQNVRVTEEIVRGGVGGWLDDSLAFVRPWGFDVAEIRVPVRVSYGVRDVVVPASHGDWLATHVPDAEVDVDDAGGHHSPTSGIAASISWLVGG